MTFEDFFFLKMRYPVSLTIKLNDEKWRSVKRCVENRSLRIVSRDNSMDLVGRKSNGTRKHDSRRRNSQMAHDEIPRLS